MGSRRARRSCSEPGCICRRMPPPSSLSNRSSLGVTMRWKTSCHPFNTRCWYGCHFPVRVLEEVAELVGEGKGIAQSAVPLDDRKNGLRDQHPALVGIAVRRLVSILVYSMQNSSSEPVAGSTKRRLRSWKSGVTPDIRRSGASLGRPLWVCLVCLSERTHRITQIERTGHMDQTRSGVTARL